MYVNTHLTLLYNVTVVIIPFMADKIKYYVIFSQIFSLIADLTHFCNKYRHSVFEILGSSPPDRYIILIIHVVFLPSNSTGYLGDTIRGQSLYGYSNTKDAGTHRKYFSVVT